MKEILLSGVVIFLSLISVPAFGAGKVTKQKNCRVLVEGLDVPGANSKIVIVSSDGNRLPGKVVSIVPQKGFIAEILGSKECSPVNQASVELEEGDGRAKGKSASSGSKKSGGKKGAMQSSENGPKFGVSALAGGGLMNVNLPDGDTSSLTYLSYDVGAVGDYYFTISPTVRIPVGLGMMWYKASVPIQAANTTNNTTLTYTRSFTGLFLRTQTGVILDFSKSLSGKLTPFFDVGMSGKHTVTGDASASYALKSSMRYGALLGVDYRLPSGLKFGIDGTYSMGSVTFGADFTEQEAKNYKSSAYGALLELGWDF